jgi:hypothetical protein
MHQLSRRDFMKLGAAGTGAVGVTALGFDLSDHHQRGQSG